jgi:hypothetical protein
MAFKCKNCGRPLYNRRRKTCEFCGRDIPESDRLSVAQMRFVDRLKSEEAKQHHDFMLRNQSDNSMSLGWTPLI